MFDAITFEDEKFLAAAEKDKIFKAWRRFIRSGFSEKAFTKSLYTHLHLHCNFIAHYNERVFYATYFETIPEFLVFWRQFGGDHRLAEGYGTDFLNVITWGAVTASDLNRAMIDYATQVNGKVTRVVEMYETRETEKYSTAINREALARLNPSVATLVNQALTVPFSAELQAMIAAAFGTQADGKARKAAQTKAQARQAQAQMALF